MVVMIESVVTEAIERSRFVVDGNGGVGIVGSDSALVPIEIA